MNNLRERISRVLDLHIPEGKWNILADKISPSGEPTKIKLNKIIFILCEEIENLNKTIQDLKQKGK